MSEVPVQVASEEALEILATRVTVPFPPPEQLEVWDLRSSPPHKNANPKPTFEVWDSRSAFPHKNANPKPQTPNPKSQTKYGTYKTVKARFLRWLSGKGPEKNQVDFQIPNFCQNNLNPPTPQPHREPSTLFPRQ